MGDIAIDRVPRTERGRQTLRRLLDAAASEFGERGYHEAAITGITARAGVALGSFYTYFESKEELYRALVRDMSRSVRHHIAEQLQGVSDRLTAERRGIAAYIGFVREHPNLYRIIEEAQFVAEDVYREHYDVFIAAYRDNLAAARARGEISEGPDEARAWALIGISVFAGMRYGLWSQDETPEAIADTIGDLIIYGLAPRGKDDGR
ncbi:putative transcriptional regulator, TetR family protein [Sphingomonas sp. DBB INV C78]|uniref:TetR/AcrR family transcriptional regulator n=1 Tax=Sphingomonas sp. DBB INV C78 TaxID=3349434 RepID=UPI0036D311C5